MARLPYQDREQLAAEAQPIWDEIGRQRQSVAKIFRILLHSPEAARRVAAVGEYTRYHSRLRPPWRELAILVTARELGCTYEWAYHRPIAEQAGVSDLVLAVIERDGPVSELPMEEGIIVQYAQELLQQRRVSAATFQMAHALLGTEGLVDLTVLLGYYSLLALALFAFEVEEEPVTAPEGQG